MVFDWVGRTLPRWIGGSGTPKWRIANKIAVLVRVIWILIFWFCASTPKRHPLLVEATTDWIPFVIMALFATSNGFCGSNID